MKSIVLATALSVASLFAFGSASAQSKNMVNVTVPFAFVVGPATVPAGSYTIFAGPDSPFVRFVSASGDHSYSVLGSPADTLAADSTGRLIFHHYGDQYFLTRISQPHSSANLHFSQTKAEKRAKQRVEQAGLPAEDPILVALN